MRLAKRGDGDAILARLFVARRKGEVIDALRRFDGQERTRMKFRENGRARLVLEVACLPGLPAALAVKSLHRCFSVSRFGFSRTNTAPDEVCQSADSRIREAYR